MEGKFTRMHIWMVSNILRKKRQLHPGLVEELGPSKYFTVISSNGSISFPIFSPCSKTEIDELAEIYPQGKSGLVYKHYQIIVFIWSILQPFICWTTNWNHNTSFRFNLCKLWHIQEDKYIFLIWYKMINLHQS